MTKLSTSENCGCNSASMVGGNATGTITINYNSCPYVLPCGSYPCQLPNGKCPSQNENIISPWVTWSYTINNEK